MQYIKWNGKVGTREFEQYKLVFHPGQTLPIEDETAALDIMTQPDEPFEEIEPGHPDYPGSEPAQLKNITGMSLRHLRALKKLDVTELSDLAGLDEAGIETLAEAMGLAVKTVDKWVDEARRLAGAIPQVS